jgi:hypothetical protein
MSKRVSDIQRIINFAMGADEGALNTAIESLSAIWANRYPKAKGTSKPRKSRSDKGKSRLLPGTEEAVAETRPGDDGAA